MARRPLPRLPKPFDASQKGLDAPLADVVRRVWDWTNPADSLLDALRRRVVLLEQRGSEGGNTNDADLLAIEDEIADLDARVTSLEGAYTSVPFWCPDAVPVSPHAKDDEFDGGSIDAKWTEWDVPGMITPALDTTRKMLTMSAAGDGNLRLAGLRQAVPAGGEFVIYSKMGVIAEPASTSEAVLFVADDISGAPSTADIHGVGFFVTSGTAFGAETWDATQASGGTFSAATTRTNLPPGGYARIRINGTACHSDVSWDGVHWVNLGSVTLGYTPSYMGVAILSFTNATTARSLHKFFRCQSGAGTSGIDATHIGRYLNTQVAA